MLEISLENQSDSFKLHCNTIDLLFKHKNEISRKLCDIRGICSIDHVAINIINPSNEIAIFSITPSVEYNIIINELWRFDNSLCPASYEEGSLVWWDQTYSEYSAEIRQLKEKKHGFSLGFNLLRNIEGYCLVYSFATRSQENNLKEYYISIIDQLFHLGDYGYKLIRDIYLQYCTPLNVPPYISTNIHLITKKPYLRLMIGGKI